MILTDEEIDAESFETWNAKQHGDPEEIGFLQALRIAYCHGQDSMKEAVQSAVIAKLSQGVEMPEPFGLFCGIRYDPPKTKEFFGMVSGEAPANKCDLYTADQLQTAIAAARLKESERCANWLDEQGVSTGGQDLDPYKLAIGIRALKGTTP